MRRNFTIQHDNDPRHASKSIKERLNPKTIGVFDWASQKSDRSIMFLQERTGKYCHVKLWYTERLLPKNTRWSNKTNASQSLRVCRLMQPVYYTFFFLVTDCFYVILYTVISHWRWKKFWHDFSWFNWVLRMWTTWETCCLSDIKHSIRICYQIKF